MHILTFAAYISLLTLKRVRSTKTLSQLWKLGILQLALSVVSEISQQPTYVLKALVRIFTHAKVLNNTYEF